jgi:hypothetical protein
VTVPQVTPPSDPLVLEPRAPTDGTPLPTPRCPPRPGWPQPRRAPWTPGIIGEDPAVVLDGRATRLHRPPHQDHAACP